MRGRKPKPTALKVLQGNAGRRPINGDEPKPNGIPEPPEHLDDIAMERWTELVPELKRLGVLTEMDRDALAGYCSKYSDWVRADTIVKQSGIFVINKDDDGKPTGTPFVNPAYYIAAKALKQLTDMGVEFGLTPSSRSRINAKPEEPSKPGKFGTFDGGKK